MSQRREVPCGNLLSLPEERERWPSSRPRSPQQAWQRPQARQRSPQRREEVPCGNLVSFGDVQPTIRRSPRQCAPPQRQQTPRGGNVPCGNLLDLSIPSGPMPAMRRPPEMIRRRAEVPCGNLLNLTDADDIRPPPCFDQDRLPEPLRPQRARRQPTNEVPCGNLVDVPEYDDMLLPEECVSSESMADPLIHYVPFPPPLPRPVTPTEQGRVMRYKPAPGNPGRLKPMFTQDWYEDIERRYPNEPLTKEEMLNLYEYPDGQGNSMGPWFRDTMDFDRYLRGASVLPGERATGFENICGTDPNMPYGPESGWYSDEWLQQCGQENGADDFEQEEEVCRERFSSPF